MEQTLESRTDPREEIRKGWRYVTGQLLALRIFVVNFALQTAAFGTAAYYLTLRRMDDPLDVSFGAFVGLIGLVVAFLLELTLVPQILIKQRERFARGQWSRRQRKRQLRKGLDAAGDVGVVFELLHARIMAACSLYVICMFSLMLVQFALSEPVPAVSYGLILLAILLHFPLKERAEIWMAQELGRYRKAKETASPFR